LHKTKSLAEGRGAKVLYRQHRYAKNLNPKIKLSVWGAAVWEGASFKHSFLTFQNCFFLQSQSCRKSSFFSFQFQLPTSSTASQAGTQCNSASSRGGISHPGTTCPAALMEVENL